MRTFFFVLLALICASVYAVTIQEAIGNKDVAALEQLLSDNPSLVDQQDVQGNTPLHLALLDSDARLADAVLNHNPRLDRINNRGTLPIHLAAQKHSLVLVKRLISMGAEISAPDTLWGGNSLHWAADGGNLEVIRFLIEQGLDLNQTSKGDWKPVDKAVAKGQLEALKLLLAKGATLPEPNNPDDYFFIVAIGSGNTELVSYLIDKGFDPNFRTRNGDLAINQPVFRNQPDILKLLIQRGAIINGVFDRYNFAPLHVAAFRGNAELATILLDNGADIDIPKPIDGSSPLQFAIEMQKNEVAKLLVNRGANLSFTDMAGNSLLNAAIMWDNNEMAYYLIERGADYTGANCASPANCPNPVNPPLLNAAIRNAEMLNYLLDKGININLTNSEGDTALIMSVYSDSMATMQSLINRKAELDIRNNRGQTAFMVACNASNVLKANLLLTAGCNISLQDADGKSALHYAAINGNKEILDILAGKGIKLNVKDRNKHTAMDYAQIYSQPEIAASLKVYGAKASKLKSNIGLQQRLKPNEMPSNKIWYLHHSGMAVRLDNRLLIFDYWKQEDSTATPSLYNGWINPEDIKYLDVYVFVSHSDEDHYDRRILEWKQIIPNLKFVFGFRPEQTQAFRQQNYYLPDYTYVAKDSSCVLDGIEIKTLSSPIDDGSGFYVEAGGIRILHCGDAVNQTKPLPSEFSRSVDHLATQTSGVDYAFIPMLGCGMNDVEALNIGSDYLISKLQPKLIIPMHSGGSEYKYGTWRDSLNNRGLSNKVHVFHNSGDFLLLKQL